MSEYDDRTKGFALLVAIVGSIFIYYFANNAYEAWSETANPILVVIFYYFGTQPIYDLFMGLFTYEIYKEDESVESALKGLAGAIMITVGLDLTGLPFAFPSILNPSQTVTLQTSLAASPYADFALARWLAGPSGVVGFWLDLFVHVILPIILVSGALLLVRWNMFVELVERS